MNNKNFPNNQERAKNVLRIQAKVSKGTRLSELGYFDGLEGKEAQYPHFLMYYMAWCNGHREYLLGESKPVA